MRVTPAPATTSPATVVSPIGWPSTGHDAIAVVAGTTNSRLLARVAPRVRTRKYRISGPPMALTNVSHPVAPSARAVNGTSSPPVSSAHGASTAPATTHWIDATRRGSTSRAWCRL